MLYLGLNVLMASFFLFFVILFAGFNEKGLIRLTFLLCISEFLAHSLAVLPCSFQAGGYLF